MPHVEPYEITRVRESEYPKAVAHVVAGIAIAPLAYYSAIAFLARPSPRLLVHNLLYWSVLGYEIRNVLDHLKRP